jgi:hypothetical protein
MIIENDPTNTPAISHAEGDVSFINAPMAQVWLLKLALFYLVPKSQGPKPTTRGQTRSRSDAAEMVPTSIETCYELAFLAGVKGPRKNDDPLKSIRSIVRRIQRRVSVLEQEIKGRHW